jgi:hypothetical protein
MRLLSADRVVTPLYSKATVCPTRFVTACNTQDHLAHKPEGAGNQVELFTGTELVAK